MRYLGCVLLVLVASACGDNNAVPIDAPPDMPGSSTACNDGIDNDADGKIDFPVDPGCAAPNQDDEVDTCPDGAGCPQCGNGVDDDGNGQTDYPDDTGCMSAADPTEVIDDPTACGSMLAIRPLPVSGVDFGVLDTTSTSQLTSTCNAVAGVPAVAYRLNLTMPTILVASTASSAIDTVLDLRAADCDAATASIACHDNVSASNRTSYLERAVPAGNYFLVVSGAATSDVGAYNLEVDLLGGQGAGCSVTPQCGPGLVCRTPLGAPAMVCTVPECMDALDDDGDGEPGFPTDPGCANAADNDEADDCPGGAGCPACANAEDDDGDGDADYPGDAACVSASGSSEVCAGEIDPVVTITGALTQSTLVGAADNHDPTCGGNGGGDVLFTLTVPPMVSLTIDTENSLSVDTVLSLLPSTCAEPSIECDDNDGAAPPLSSLITRTNVAAGTYVVAVDNFDTTKAPGPIDVNVEGVIAPGGSCEPVASLGGALVCPATNPCEGAVGAQRCRPNACGDGADNDADGKDDFPEDPGCTSADDNDEADACPGAGPGCPECADGVDNDGDGDVDADDPTCITPSQPSEGCVSSDGMTTITTPVTIGTTIGALDDLTPTCGTSTTLSAPDKLFRLELPAMRTFTIANTNSFDGLTSLFDASCGVPLTCADEPEIVGLDNAPAGTYYYAIDGDGTSAGTFSIAVTGTIQVGASCESALAQSGAITCGTGFACRGAPGARTCQRARCADGVDNDGDGRGDFPNDPGCTDVSDDDESDPCPGAGCPACGDGADNDGDGFTDYPLDATCLAASSASETCISSEPVTPLVLPLTLDTTTGALHDTIPTCGFSANTAPDRMYSLTVPALATLTIDNQNPFDAVVALYGASCGPSAIACSDAPENLALTNLAAGTYYYLVDGFSSGSGPISIAVSGTIAPGASCESPLVTTGVLTCTSGFACAGAAGARTCQAAACNDTVDNDGDGDTDYPQDPGCTATSDSDESDPCPAAGCPACGDGADNDGDTFADFPLDPQCVAASSDFEACRASEGIPAIVTAVTIGTTATAMNDNAIGGTAVCSSTTSTAGDRVYRLDVPATATLSITNANEFDASIRLYNNGTCTGSPLFCVDEPEDISINNLAAGTYLYEVDGFSSGTGPYVITVRGTIAPGSTCEHVLVDTGVLRCTTGHACAGAPGARTCVLAACADGVDNDGDGATDYPAEPGCAFVEDHDETNPVPAPACANTADDDGDSLVDWPADFGCLAAGTSTEVFCAPETNPTRAITATPTTGTTAGMASNFAGQTCQPSTPGNDVAFALQLPVPVASLVLDTSNSNLDTVLSLRDITCGTSLGCDDNTGTPGNESRLTVANVPAGTYAVVVDGFTGPGGPFTLAVTGTVAAGTSCTSPLFAAGVLVCPTGTTCTGASPTCQ